MASNTSKLVVSELDFDNIKTNLKEFLRSQSQFSDYDFDGSSLSILIDLLAYNTHYNAYYANMIANEMFLDTAVFRESIVSLAKMIGYTPGSRNTSKGYINLTVWVKKVDGYTPPTTITFDKYSTLKTSVGTSTYTFLTNENNVLNYDASNTTTSAWAYKKTGIRIIEGTHVHYEYIVTDADIFSSGSQYAQHYIVPSGNADIKTLNVSVKNSPTDNVTTNFVYAGELQTITSSDAVYWLHEVEDNKYEVKFGDGQNIGVGIVPGNIIQLDYIVTNGENANGAKVFQSTKRTYANSGSSWYGTLKIVEESYTLETTSYRVLDLIQDYTSDFSIGETVVGKLGSASGIVNEWDPVNLILKLVSVLGVFSINETVIGMDSNANGIIKLTSIETSKSGNGTERESINSIKNLAPKVYQAQNRCVTTEDYETIIKRDYPGARAVRVWGGDSMTPPQYGKVFLSIRPHTGTYLTNTEKEYINNTILGPRNIVTIKTEIVDPDYLYVIPTCKVKYNPSLIVGGMDNIIGNVGGVINNYAFIHLNDFASPLYYSKLATDIDNSDESISSNILSFELKKAVEPSFGVYINEEIKFSNKLTTGYISSTKFTFGDTVTGLPISNCEFKPSEVNNNVLQVVKYNNGVKSIICGGENTGSINYTTGTITLNNFKTTYTNEVNESYPEMKGLIYIKTIPNDNDIFTKENQIIDILPSDITVSKTDVRTLI